MDNQLIKRLKKELKDSLPERRYVHTIGVAYTAASLAMRYEYSIEDAMVAGLLHDCAKYFDDEKMIEICKEHEIEIRDVERHNPFLLHGKAGSILAKEKYGITDEKIQNAIRYHTTGKPAMNLLEKIIFTADFIEPGRKQLEGLDAVRKLAFIDLDQAVMEILDMTIRYLGEDGEKEMDSMTVQTYEYYRNLERRM